MQMEVVIRMNNVVIIPEDICQSMAWANYTFFRNFSTKPSKRKQYLEVRISVRKQKAIFIIYVVSVYVDKYDHDVMAA